MTLVLDASILIKLFRDEPDSPIAKSLVTHCAEQRIPFMSPDLALYEILSVALHYDVPFELPLALLDGLRRTGFALLEPTVPELLQARHIATSKSPSHGYPELKDSIYHSMAIQRGGTFLTADQRHIGKASSFGNVQLLADWRPTTPPRP